MVSRFHSHSLTLLTVHPRNDPRNHRRNPHDAHRQSLSKVKSGILHRNLLPLVRVLFHAPLR